MLFANYYQQDRVKNASFEEIDRHHTYNPTYTNRLLRTEFLKHGVELNNPDVNVGRTIAFHLLVCCILRLPRLALCFAIFF